MTMAGGMPGRVGRHRFHSCGEHEAIHLGVNIRDASTGLESCAYEARSAFEGRPVRVRTRKLLEAKTMKATMARYPRVKLTAIQDDIDIMGPPDQVFGPVKEDADLTDTRADPAHAKACFLTRALESSWSGSRTRRPDAGQSRRRPSRRAAPGSSTESSRTFASTSTARS